MLKLKKLATVLLAGPVVFALSLPVKDTHSLSTTPVSSGLILDGGFDVVPDGAGNFYIFSYDKENPKTVLSCFSPLESQPLNQSKFYNASETRVEDFLNYKYDVGKLSNNLLYTAHIDGRNSIIERFEGKNISSQKAWVPTELRLDNTAINTPQKIAIASDDNIFLLKGDNETTVCVRNMDEEIANIKLSTNDESIAAITTDISKTYLYAATNKALYRYKVGSTPYEFESTSISAQVVPFKFLTDNIFITSAGKIYTLSDSKFELENTTEIQVKMENYPVCVAIAGFDNASILAKTAEKVVSRISCSDGKVICSKTFDDKVVAVSTSGDKTIVITEKDGVKSIHLVDEEDFPIPKDEEVTTPGGDVADPDNPNPPSETPKDTTIESTEGYDIGENTISKIPAGTALGALKNGLMFDGFSLALKDSNGNVKTASSTKIATGYTVTFVKDGAEYKTFTLIVEGDVTGSGNISTKSISALANHLLGKSELDGVFLNAANLSGDGDLSTVDLLLMYKQTQK